MTVKEAVYNQMKSRRWINGMDLEMDFGPSALRRLRELREDFDIKVRKNPQGDGSDYRLVGPRS